MTILNQNPQMRYQVILEKWNELDALLRELNLKDSSTPGLRREVQLANILGHLVHQTKHGPDAYNSVNDEKYEYLCAKIGKSVQMDRIDLTNVEKRLNKNFRIYAAFFNDDSTVERLYEVSTQAMLDSAIEKIKRGMQRAESKGKHWTSKHVGWTEDEILKLNPKLVYEKSREPLTTPDFPVTSSVY